MNHRQIFEHYTSVFPKHNVDRFTIACPDCGTGRNSEGAGGNDRCFHCDSCGLVECDVTSPALLDWEDVENTSINENDED